MFRTNVLSAFRITQAIAKSMVKATPRSHHRHELDPPRARWYRSAGIYCGTKHALSAITRGLRLELRATDQRSRDRAGMVDTASARARHPRVLEALKGQEIRAAHRRRSGAAVVYAPRRRRTAARISSNCAPGSGMKRNSGFNVSHLKKQDFRKGLRSYAQYAIWAWAKATHGMVQAHVIRLITAYDPKGSRSALPRGGPAAGLRPEGMDQVGIRSQGEVR